MTDKNFKFGKSLWDLLASESILYSTNADIYVSISEWENVPTPTKSLIITKCTSLGFEEEE